MYSKIIYSILSFFSMTLTDAKYAFLGFTLFIIFDQLIANSRGNRYIPLILTSLVCLILTVCNVVFLNQHGYGVLISLICMLLIPFIVTFICKKRAS